MSNPILNLEPYNGDAKICSWDLECTNLKGDFGFLLCGCYKFLGDPIVHTVRIDQFRGFKQDPTNDKRLAVTLASVLAKADAWVTHYGDRFDRRFLNTRLLYHGQAPLPPIRMIDTWRIAHDNLALTSNRLATVAELFNLPGKTPLKRQCWIKAMAGDRASLNYIAAHCKADVLALESSYLRLRCLCGKHINVSVFQTSQDGRVRCPVCGSTHVQRRGYGIAMARISQRFQCANCGAWGHGKPEKPGLRREIKFRKCV